MSSSRSDVVTKFVCLRVCLSVIQSLGNVKGDKRASQVSFKDLLRAFQEWFKRFFKSFLRLFQGCFQKFQASFKGILRFLRMFLTLGFKCVLKKFLDTSRDH